MSEEKAELFIKSIEEELLPFLVQFGEAKGFDLNDVVRILFITGISIMMKHTALPQDIIKIKIREELENLMEGVSQMQPVEISLASH